MISGTLVALGPFFMPALLVVFIALCWLARWLLDKGGWCRVPAWLIIAYLSAVSLAALGVIQ